MSEQNDLTLRDKTRLFVQVQEHSSPVWVIVTHGIGEHSGRHHYLDELLGHDFNICYYDLRSHGKSSGKRAHVQNFDDFIEDLHELIQHLKDRYKMQRYVLFGHSMGALITAAYIQQRAVHEFYPEKIILNAPLVGLPGIMGKIVKMSSHKIWKRVSQLPVSVPLKGLVDLNELSHNPEVAKRYKSDDLNCLKLHSNLIFGMVRKSKDVFSRPLRPRCPAYVSVGSKDQIVSPKEIEVYFTMVEKAFQLKVIEGAKHEIHNEIEKLRRPYFEHLKAVFYESRYRDE